MIAVARVPCLRELDLRKTPVSDAGLPHLHAARSLRLIELEETRVSSTAVAALQDALPGCVILR